MKSIGRSLMLFAAAVASAWGFLVAVIPEQAALAAGRCAIADGRTEQGQTKTVYATCGGFIE